MPEGQLLSVTWDPPYPLFSQTEQKSAERGAPLRTARGEPGAWQQVLLLYGTLRSWARTNCYRVSVIHITTGVVVLRPSGD